MDCKKAVGNVLLLIERGRDIPMPDIIKSLREAYVEDMLKEHQARKAYLIGQILGLNLEAFSLESLEAAYSALMKDYGRYYSTSPEKGNICLLCEIGVVTDTGCSYCGAGWSVKHGQDD